MVRACAHSLIARPRAEYRERDEIDKRRFAHWLNRQGFFKGKFYWQDDYFAISVSESQVAEVRGYIDRQEEHHKAVRFDREFLMLDKVVRGEAG